MNDQINNGQEQKQAPAANAGQTSFYSPQTQVGQGAGFGQDTTSEHPAVGKASSAESISWSASEYTHSDKGFGWIIALMLVAVLLTAVAVWMQVWTFAVLIIVMTIAFGIVAFRPPKMMHYMLNGGGLQVNEKQYSFSEFRAFGILNDGSFYTIMLIPTKRFMPSLSIHFSEDQGEKIVDIIGARLPQEEIHHDVVEKTMKRLHF